jgi:hypothetical protein
MIEPSIISLFIFMNPFLMFNLFKNDLRYKILWLLALFGHNGRFSLFYIIEQYKSEKMNIFSVLLSLLINYAYFTYLYI